MPRGNFEERRLRDKWKIEEGCIVRVHRRARRALFTPLDVKMSDTMKDKQLDCLRVTRGFFEDGSSFVEKDSWTNPSRAHLVTAKPWTGVSVFMCSERPESTGDSVRGVSKT